jgi:hypothetical protein
VGFTHQVYPSGAAWEEYKPVDLMPKSSLSKQVKIEGNEAGTSMDWMNKVQEDYQVAQQMVDKYQSDKFTNGGSLGSKALLVPFF